MEPRTGDASVFEGFGVVSFHLGRAALCCEASCEAIFDIGPRRNSQSVVCPGCGGASWVPLAKFIPSLRMPSRSSVPVVHRIRA